MAPANITVRSQDPAMKKAVEDGTHEHVFIDGVLDIIPKEEPINCSYCMDSGIDPDNGLKCAMPAHDSASVQVGAGSSYPTLGGE